MDPMEPQIAQQNRPVEEEQLICDFSSMFKGREARKMPELSSVQPISTPSWLLEIPAKLDIDKENLMGRRFIEQRRWATVTKCSNYADKLISATLTSWNYLFPEHKLKVQQVKTILTDKAVSPHTVSEHSRAEFIMSLFRILCDHADKKGSSEIIVKMAPPQPIEANQQIILPLLHSLLKDQSCSLVYLTHDNVLCPIGYETTPWIPLQAYNRTEKILPQDTEQWIITSSLARMEPTFLIKRWSDIKTDLKTVWPSFLDLNETKKGIQRRAEATEENENEARGTSNCIMALRRV